METQQKEALINQVKQRFQLMVAHLSEKDKRIWAASEAIVNTVYLDTVIDNIF
ncbi:conserved hypothetical protein [delta proteobacterium NaphS2]|nr:conserved hypothetical protein [delta proteobacterium NaphS2]